MRQRSYLLLAIHTDTRQRRKPSETICPATVAMRDALSPENRSAMAKMTAAPVQGLRNRCLCVMELLTSSNHVTKNVMGIVEIRRSGVNPGLMKDGAGEYQYSMIHAT